MATTPDYTINYEDPRLNDVKLEETKQLTEDAQLGEQLMNNAEHLYDDAIANTEKWKETQSQIQQEQTDFTIEQIEQQKEQAQKDYTKEQAGAYVDWRKQSNQYGSEAEKMASAGLSKTGFSESSQVSMYNAYQNRIAVAREAFGQAVLNYNNAIKDARLKNNAALAEIAQQALEKQTEYIIKSALHQEDLLKYMADKKMQTKQFYYTKWQDVLAQMNKENELKWQTDQAALNREHDKTMAEINHKYDLKRDEINNAFTEKMAGINHDYEIKLLNAKTEKEKELLEEQHKNDMEKLSQQQKNAMAQLDKELANEKAILQEKHRLEQYNFGSGGGGGGGSNNSTTTPYKEAQAEKFGKVNNTPAVSTAYYQGSLNPDANKYGTFSNGYQPKGITGHGTLTKTKKTIEVQTQVKYGVDKGKKQTLVQTVWKAEDGTKWYWEGRRNKYIQIK